LIHQRAAFGERGKISGNVIAGVYDKERKLFGSKIALEIEYTAMAKILQIDGMGIRDDSTSFCYPQNYEENLRPPCPPLNREFPGQVRIKRTWLCTYLKLHLVVFCAIHLGYATGTVPEGRTYLGTHW